MIKGEGKAEVIEERASSAGRGFRAGGGRGVVQVALEAEMTEAIGAEKGERTETRLSYRSGYYSCSLITRVGTLELRAAGPDGAVFDRIVRAL